EAVRRGRLLLRNQMEWGPRLGRRGRGRLALVGPRRRGLHPALSRATRAPTLAGGHAGRRRADGRAWRAAAPAEPVAASLPDRCVEDPPGGTLVSGAGRGLRPALPRLPGPAAGAPAAAARTAGRAGGARGGARGALVCGCRGRRHGVLRGGRGQRARRRRGQVLGRDVPARVPLACLAEDQTAAGPDTPPA